MGKCERNNYPAVHYFYKVSILLVSTFISEVFKFDLLIHCFSWFSDETMEEQNHSVLELAKKKTSEFTFDDGVVLSLK